MFVIADIEWVTNDAGRHSPTQIAAARVDENWNATEEFDSFICPKDATFRDWKHIAYTGGKIADFIYARSAYTVFKDFLAWLNEDDVLLWWADDSSVMFKKLSALLFDKEEGHKAISMNGYVYTFLDGQACSRGNPYKLAERRGGLVDAAMKHSSKNDVRVVRELMKAIAYPQSNLLKPLVMPKKKAVPNRSGADRRYQYDATTNLIHIKDCSAIEGVETCGYLSLQTPLRKGYIPCECCRDEHKLAFKERNRSILERVQYTYVYSPDSKVFHKPTCGHMLLVKNILGTRKYETVIKTGRQPCKICNPTSDDLPKPLPIREKKVIDKEKKTERLGKEEAKAIKRQKVALEERLRRLEDRNLSESEKTDVLTLTQPSFAFWASQGYQTFHLHSCPKLHSASNLRGFRTYEDAVRAGYSPCRKCKPSAKQNMVLSIPITSRVREGERIEDLEVLCNETGYLNYREDTYFNLETAVGKWRIDVSSFPIKVEHINLVKTPDGKEYHTQPRLFLSLIDTFKYIKKHDEVLASRSVS